jgi:hypothetical protein
VIIIGLGKYTPLRVFSIVLLRSAELRESETDSPFMMAISTSYFRPLSAGGFLIPLLSSKIIQTTGQISNASSGTCQNNGTHPLSLIKPFIEARRTLTTISFFFFLGPNS